MRVLALAPSLPWPLDAGGRLRTYHLLRALAPRHQLRLFCVRQPGAGPEAEEALHAAGLDPRGFERSPAGGLAALVSPRPARWFHSRELRLSLGAPGALDAFDLVHLDEPCLLPALPRDLGVPLVVHHHKLDLELARDIAPPGVRRSLEVARWRRLENEAVERSVHHVFCSPEDARRFKARHPRVEARVVENGFDPTHFHPTAPELREERLLLVLGSLDYAPNLRGLERFLREGWPPLAVQVPDLRLAVGGRGAPTALGRGWPPGVELVGAVEDVRPWLARATALVVPLEVGGGTRLKIIEAAASGCPVVTTAVGAEGLALHDGEHLWAAEDLAGLGPALTRALECGAERRRRAERAAALVERRYPWELSAARLEEAWDVVARSTVSR